MAQQSTLPAHRDNAADFLYLVELRGADCLESCDRTALEAEFRRALDEVCGGAEQAAGAVHARWDCDEDSLDPLEGGPGYFDSLYERAEARLKGLLPLGARFVCSPDFEALPRPRA